MNQIGRYRVLRTLGKGGMGTVYLAEDPSGQQVAIKVINPEFSQHESFRMRFRREAEAAQRVRRFCTAAVLDAALDGDLLYVVTEYVPGPNLEEAVRQHGPLRGSSLDALAVSVATALTAIHAAGVVHRDLKPSNVLLSPVGPRVIDFGIARALDTLGGITGTGELIGTPRYMAPEMLRGEPVTPACDVFSWGCLVAFAASGRSPFPGDTIPSIIYHIMNTEPQLDGLEPGLRELVVAALDKDPARRPTAQQLLDQLVGRSTPPEQMVQQAWQQGGLTLPQQTVPQHPERTLPYEPAGAATGQPQATLAYTQHTPPAPTSPTTPVSTTVAKGDRGGRGRNRLLGVIAAAAVLIGGGVAVWKMVVPSGPPTDLPLLWQDDFTYDSSGWPGGRFSSTNRYEDGWYHVESSFNKEQRVAAPIPFDTGKQASPAPTPGPSLPPVPSTLVISADVAVKEVEGQGEYGLYCRGQGGHTYYEFVLDTAGNARIRRVADSAGGNLTEPVKVEGLKDTVRMVAACEQSGSAVKLGLWINGKQIHSVKDPNPLKNGTVGVFTRISDGATELHVAYDNFELRGGD
ncbi:serine/threonine-protein kinase [Thermobispora bispora]|uniref:Serine/threonine protein kinase n=1 Tax=Thermobispora bispora (strain ATCC 19993 / DSM 43833 / CBS 139.67 / JCM 10125 / KCTC 9307 / NBRC 14880 / R51) TaxID=469371 RepID=D6Y584_THEBD|nr:serine/threonine-protein kinase [Thermobispora bispora]ADG89279.1 serine/threonine protein kinase [Thermobispora bispora DSM 43833]